MSIPLPVPELVMLTGSAASAACCAVPSARAALAARSLALAMAVVMGAHVLGVDHALDVGAVVVTGLAVVLVTGPRTASGRAVEAHRATGAVLMVVMMLAQHHLSSAASMAGMAGSAAGGAHHGSLAGQALTAVVVAGAGFLVWTAWATVRSCSPTRSWLLAAEDLGMGVAVGAVLWSLLPSLLP